MMTSIAISRPPLSRPVGIMALLLFVASSLTTLSQSSSSSRAIYLESSLASQYLVTGEQTYLKISIRNARQGSRPAAPVIANTAVNFVRNMVEMDSRRGFTQSFVYRLRPAKPGIYQVPAVKATSGGRQYTSQALSFEVRDPDELIRIPSGVAGQDVLAAWFPAKSTLYVGEQCPVTLKIYVPRALNPTSWGMPEPEKNNCLAWRFNPPSRDSLGEVIIDNKSYISAPFQTTMSGISAGTATFGPTSLNIVSRQRRMDPRRGIVISDKSLSLELPAIDFRILPLPPGAPDGFKGAVGRFSLRAESKNATIKDTDAAEVLIRIEGEGNLENIEAPQPGGPGWKVIDSSKVERGGERRHIRGAVTFRQILRPEPSATLPTTIPPYELSFFNPDNQSYYTLSTAAIPISVQRTLTAPPQGPTQTTSPPDPETQTPEQMSDILGFIKHSQPVTSTEADKLTSYLRHYWQLIPALLCLVLIAIPLSHRIKAYRQSNSGNRDRKQALKAITEATDTKTFYRRAGRFIEQWLNPDEELKQILAERDEHCFSADQKENTGISAERRQQITDLIKRHAKLCLILMLACLSICQLRAASDGSDKAEPATSRPADASQAGNKVLAALEQGQYQTAIELYEEQYPDPARTPADILYNIGNCHYHLEQAGPAALAWRRALARQPDHQQARKNLRFIELKKGAIVPEIKPWQEKLTSFPQSLYQTLYQASLWLLLIIIFVLRVIKPAYKTPLIVIALLMPFTALLGVLGSYFYPDSDFRSPFDQQAVCLEQTSLYSQAHREAQTTMTLSSCSLVTINSTRDSWLHITTADEQSGWVESKSVARVIPADQ